jgi:phage host-nuclease inhibitor protein Gam
MEKDTTSNEELVELIKAGFDHVGEEISSLRTELKGEISSLRTELKNEISMVRNDLSSETSSIRTEISSLRSEMQEGFMKTNDKVDLLTVKLQEKNVITKSDAKEVMAISPLPLA